MLSLFDAVHRGSLTDVITYIDAGCDVNEPEESLQHFPLIEAAAQNRYDMVAFLLKAGADVNVVDSGDRSTALSCAVKNNNQALIDLLLRYRVRKKHQLMTSLADLVCQVGELFHEKNKACSLLEFVALHGELFHTIDALITSLLKEYKQDDDVKAYISYQRSMLPLKTSLVSYVSRIMVHPEFLAHKSLLEPRYYSRYDHHGLMKTLLTKIRTELDVVHCERHWLVLARYCYENFPNYQLLVRMASGFVYPVKNRSPSSVQIGFLGHLMLNKNYPAFRLMLEQGMNPETTQLIVSGLKFSTMKMALMLHVKHHDKNMSFAKHLGYTEEGELTPAPNGCVSLEASESKLSLPKFLADRKFLATCHKAKTLANMQPLTIKQMERPTFFLPKDTTKQLGDVRSANQARNK